MEYLKCNDFDQQTAISDIFYCFSNANTKADYNVGKDNDQMFVRNPHFYLNPSDNVKEALKGNVKDGDRVATVAGSGDYMFECIFNGAREVINYDINVIQYYVLCLKLWAMKSLDYEEYVNFLTALGDSYLDFKVINRVIKEHSSEAAYPFWEYFMKARRIEKYAIQELKFNPFIGAALLFSSLGKNATKEIIDHVLATEVGPSLMAHKFKGMRLVQCYTADKESLDYIASEENYNLVKSRLDDVKISFINCNVTELHNVIDGKCNVVFLSNIPFYLSASTIVDLIDNGLMGILEDGGRICAYHQGMRLRWFKDVVYDSNFKISRREFNMNYEAIHLNIAGVQNVLQAHRELCKRRNKFTLREIPTYGGAPEMRVDTDVLSFVKKRGC